MIPIPSSQDEFLMTAMRNYDPSCISIIEFRKDLRSIKKIHKTLESYINKEEVNLRFLLNSFLVVFNQFNEASSALIFYGMSDEMINLACHFIIKLGRRDSLIDSKQLNTDKVLLEQLYSI